MRFPGIAGPRVADVRRGGLLVVILWTIAAVLFGMFPGGLAGDVSVAVVSYWSAVVFASATFTVVVFRISGAEKVFWLFFGGGMVVRFAGEVVRGGANVFGLPWGVAVNNAAYGVSYVLLFGALLWLVARVTRRITLISTVDAVSVMLSSGLLIWYFILTPAAAAGQRSFLEILPAVSGLALDVGLLYLGLVVLSVDRRPRFSGLLVTALVLFVLADGIYLNLRPFGPYEIVELPALFWALGVSISGLAAMKAVPSDALSANLEIPPWRVFSFWLGPLSPPLHYGLLLAWAAFSPRPPQYLLLGGVILMFLLALRISLISSYSRGLRRDGETLARRKEQGRISEELHGSLMESVQGTSLLLDSYLAARARGDAGLAEKALESAVDASREANYQVGRPIGELRVLCRASEVCPEDLLDQLLQDVERYFGVVAYKDLRSSLELLDPEELAVAYRVVGEALWNAAKHSGAKHMWLESRDVGGVVIVKVRDDGRRLSVADAGSSLGCLRARAEKVGGKLDVISRSPAPGMTVQARFDKR